MWLGTPKLTWQIDSHHIHLRKTLWLRRKLVIAKTLTMLWYLVFLSISRNCFHSGPRISWLRISNSTWLPWILSWFSSQAWYCLRFTVSTYCSLQDCGTWDKPDPRQPGTVLGLVQCPGTSTFLLLKCTAGERIIKVAISLLQTCGLMLNNSNTDYKTYCTRSWHWRIWCCRGWICFVVFCTDKWRQDWHKAKTRLAENVDRVGTRLAQSRDKVGTKLS